MTSQAPDALEAIRGVRQTRQFQSKPVSDADLETLLTIAQWTGSSRNSQPWHFIAVRDPEQLRKLSEVRGDAIKWVATAPLAIALVLDGNAETSEAFDEGRLTERLLIAAKLLGLGGGTAWYGDESQRAAAKELLGIPEGSTAHSMVVIGFPEPSAQQSSPMVEAGRKPLSALVSYDRMTP